MNVPHDLGMLTQIGIGATTVLFFAAFLMMLSRIDAATGTWPVSVFTSAGWPMFLIALAMTLIGWPIGPVLLVASSAVSVVVIVGVWAASRPERHSPSS